MTRANGKSRTRDKSNTKAAMHRKCQQMTKSVVRKARHPKPIRRRHPKPVVKYNITVTNIKTHKSIVVAATGEQDALRQAIEYGLARKLDNLKVGV